MTTVTGKADSARKPRAMRSGVLRQIWSNRADYLYVLPAIVVMLIVIAYPIYYTVELSFFKTPPGLQLRDKTFVGIDNYTAILTSDVFWRVTLNTVIWTLASTIIAFVLGFAMALALHRDFFGRGILRAILIIPWVISAVAASYIWKWIYHSDFGIIGAVLVGLGLASRPPNFIDSVSTVLPSLIVVNIWREFPFAMIMMMAGLQTVPEQLLRAAQVDGASAWQRFWHVTFPHLSGVSTVTILLLAVANFNSFIIPWIMTGGGPSNASHIWITHIYELAFGRQRWGVASAYSVLLFFILMTLGYFYVRALSGGERRGAGSMTSQTAVSTPPPQARSTAGAGPAASSSLFMLLYTARADGLDAADIDQVGLRGDGVSARVVAERAHAGQLPEAARSAEQRRPGLSAILLEQPVRFDPDHDPRGAGRGAGGLRLLALQFSRTELPVLLRAAAQHVPGGDLSRPALHPDALARAW